MPLRPASRSVLQASTIRFAFIPLEMKVLAPLTM